MTETPIEPGASFAYQGSFTDTPGFVGDETRYMLDLVAGQDFTVSMTSNTSLVETEVELLDPIGAVVASSSGGPALLNAVPIDQSGTYTLLVRATYLAFPGLLPYTGSVLVNAVNEAEAVGGPSNDDIASAQDLGSAFFPLGNGVEQAVVVGDNAVVVSEIAESFETGSLGPAWTTSSSGTTQYSRIQVTTAAGAADGSRALVMDTSSSSSGFVLNEAVWTVNLSGMEDAVLSFAHAEWNDESHSLPTTFTGSYNGDGVAISDDGVTWRTILSAPNTSSGVWTPFSVNLLDVAQSAGMALGPNFKIKFQQYDDDPRSSDGRGYDDILITGLPVSPVMSDYYRVDLEQDEWLSVTLAGQESVFGKPQVELFDAGGALLTVGSGDWVDASSVISGFRAPAAGSYYIRVPRGSGEYSLVATRDATFSPEPVSASTILDIPSGKAVGAIDSGTDTDTFSFRANVGDNLVIWTETPGFDPLVAANMLDTFLELRGPDGYLQIEGGSGGVGLNALLNHTATQTGTYTIKVLSESQTTGGYTLNVTGQTGDDPAFEVVSSSLTDGATLNAKPTQLTVDLSAPARIDTIDAADLTVNGIAATAVTLVDADTLVFDLPVGLGEGVYQYHIAAGAISSLSGAPLEPFTLQVNIDTQGPYVVSTSLMPGDLLEPAKRTVTIRFNEALAEDVLNINDAQLRGPVDMVVKPIESFVYDPINYEVTLVFNAIDEGDYRLTLYSSTSAFRDLAGNPLDGEIPESPTPFETSGDGIPGGDFVIDFAVDRITPTPIGKPQRLLPYGSLLSASRYNSGNLYGSGDTDPFSVFMQPGQILTAVLSTTDAFSNTNLMLSALGVQAVSSAPGGPVVLTLPYSGPAQDVILTVSGDASTYYSLEVYLNAAAESGLAPAAGETAADLGSAFVNLPGTDVSVANILSAGQPARELTVLDKLFAPNTMNFNFTDMTTPTGDGTLTITARGDLDAVDEFITLNGEGLLITDLFVDDGGDNTIVTATLTIPQADLAEMATNGTISFTVTPSAMVGNYADTFVTLSLDYPGAPPVPVDEYALDLLAGQAVSVFIDSDADLFSFELIDVSTGLSVAQGVDDSALFDQTLRDFIAPATGRYIVRAHVPAETDYRLSVIRGAASDFEPNNTPTDPLAALDDAGAALGFLQAPGAERLFALTRVGNIPSVLELDPQTFSIINSFVPGAGQGLNISESDLAYDGQTLFVTGGFPGASGGQIFALSPDTGEILSYFRPQIGSGYDIATYLGQVVTLSKSTNLTFLDPETGAIIRELPIGIYADALVGAGPRGSIFVADTVGQTYTSIYEIDAATGGVLNSFTSTTPFASSLAFVDGHLYVTGSRTGGIEVYDPDTGVLVQVVSPGTSSIYTLGGDGVVPGSVEPDIDRYTLTLQAGEMVTLTSDTPFDHSGGMPLNSLDPAIRVFDPNGVEVAFDDNGASDGRNAMLTFTATVGGVYTIEVLSATGTGEYLLDIDRAALLPGDLDGDGFVGIGDLNIVLGHWNTSVPAGSLPDGDPSGDGFVGIEDLNTVLGNWNAGTPASAGASALFVEQSSGSQPAVEVTTQEQPASASRAAVEAEVTIGEERVIADSRRRSKNARRSVSVATLSPADASRNY
ncbi:MAG: pre-peptidase C-terminal domain-containing protein [Phycisphaerales bacterium]